MARFRPGRGNSTDVLEDVHEPETIQENPAVIEAPELQTNMETVNDSPAVETPEPEKKVTRKRQDFSPENMGLKGFVELPEDFSPPGKQRKAAKVPSEFDDAISKSYETDKWQGVIAEDPELTTKALRAAAMRFENVGLQIRQQDNGDGTHTVYFLAGVKRTRKPKAKTDSSESA